MPASRVVGQCPTAKPWWNARAFNSGKAPCRPRLSLVRATEEKSEGTGPDWDRAWKSFSDSLNKNIPVVEDRTLNPPEQKKASSRSPQFAKDSRRELRENIKKQENVLLDFWSQESFFKLGGALIVLLLLVFLVAGNGGPPE